MDGAGVGVAVDGGVGGNHGDVAVFAGGKRCFGTGGDNVDDGHSARMGADGVARDGGDGVAGNHQRLDALCEEERDDLRAVVFDGRARFDAVGDAGGIAVVDEVFKRQAFHQGAEDGEAADAAVKDANGQVAGIVHDKKRPKEASNGGMA